MEIWKPAPGYPRYEVSNEGRVRRVGTGRILKPWTDRESYCIVTLRHENGERRKVRVARLVLAAFTGTWGQEANHLNGKKNDNSLVNLEWTDRKGNAAHASRTLLLAHGPAHPQAKLTLGAVRMIRSSSKLQRELAETFGVSQSVISTIKAHREWRWV